MKTRLTILLTALAITGYSQFVYLGETKAEIKDEYKELPIAFVADDYLEYVTKSGYISFHFSKVKGKYICHEVNLCMDTLAARLYIRDGVRNGWQKTSNTSWTQAGYYKVPIIIEADRRNVTVLFKFTLKK